MTNIQRSLSKSLSRSAIIFTGKNIENTEEHQAEGNAITANETTRPFYDYLYIITSILFYGLVFLIRSSISPIEDVLRTEFNTTSSGIGFLSSSFFILYVVGQIPSGLFLQIYVAQLPLILSMFGLCILSLIFPFTTNSIIFASIIRALSGIATSGVWISLLSIVSNKFGNNYVSIIGGIGQMSGAIHVFIGNIIQSQLYQNYQVWKPIYYIIATLSFTYAIIFSFCIYKESLWHNFKRKQNNVASTANISSINLRKSMLQTIKMYLNWMISFIIFSYSLIYLGIVGLWLIPYLMLKYDYSRTLSAIIAGIVYLFASVAAIVYGELSRRFKKRKIFIIISGVLYISFVIFIYTPANIPLTVVFLLNILTGIASGVIVIFFTLTREYTHYYKIEATSTAFVNMMAQFSGFVGQYAVGALLDFHYNRKSKYKYDDYTVSDYNFAFIMVPVCLGIALCLSFCLKETNAENLDYGTQKHKYDTIDKHHEIQMDDGKVTTHAST